MCIDDPLRYLIFAILAAVLAIARLSAAQSHPVRTSCAVGLGAALVTYALLQVACPQAFSRSILETVAFNGLLTFAMTMAFIHLHRRRRELESKD